MPHNSKHRLTALRAGRRMLAVCVAVGPVALVAGLVAVHRTSDEPPSLTTSYDGRPRPSTPRDRFNRQGRWLHGAAGVSTDRIERGPESDGGIAVDPRAANHPNEVATAGDRLIRVNLTPEPVARIRLAVVGPCMLQSAAQPEPYRFEGKISLAEVEVEPTGFEIAGARYPGLRLRISPVQSPAVRIGDRVYRGDVELLRRGDRMIAVNIVPLEDYVASVVDGEMPASFPHQARAAQAILARTFALHHVKTSAGSRDFHVYATTQSQNYLGWRYLHADGRWLAGESESSRRAARETADRVLTFRGKIVATFYSAVCGGRTVQGTDVFPEAAECHESRPCEWCRNAARYRWTAQIPKSDLQNRVGVRVAAVSNVPAVVASLDDSDSPREDGPIRLVAGDARRRELTASELRRMYPRRIHSPRFQIEEAADHWRVRGRGRGHGVGLCQYGAAGQAALGRTAEQILLYYYPGTEIARVAPSSSMRVMELRGTSSVLLTHIRHVLWVECRSNTIHAPRARAGTLLATRAKGEPVGVSRRVERRAIILPD